MVSQLHIYTVRIMLDCLETKTHSLMAFLKLVAWEWQGHDRTLLGIKHMPHQFVFTGSYAAEDIVQFALLNIEKNADKTILRYVNRDALIRQSFQNNSYLACFLYALLILI